MVGRRHTCFWKLLQGQGYRHVQTLFMGGILISVVPLLLAAVHMSHEAPTRTTPLHLVIGHCVSDKEPLRRGLIRPRSCFVMHEMLPLGTRYSESVKWCPILPQESLPYPRK